MAKPSREATGKSTGTAAGLRVDYLDRYFDESAWLQATQAERNKATMVYRKRVADEAAANGR